MNKKQIFRQNAASGYVKSVILNNNPFPRRKIMRRIITQNVHRLLCKLHNRKIFLLCKVLDKMIFLRIIAYENTRKEFIQMRSYDREIFERELQLMDEISGMKFSMKKIRKLIELEALVSNFGV